MNTEKFITLHREYIISSVRYTILPALFYRYNIAVLHATRTRVHTLPCVTHTHLNTRACVGVCVCVQFCPWRLLCFLGMSSIPHGGFARYTDWVTIYSSMITTPPWLLQRIRVCSAGTSVGINLRFSRSDVILSNNISLYS